MTDATPTLEHPEVEPAVRADAVASSPITNLLQRWPVTLRLFVGSVTAVIAVVAVGVVSMTAVRRQRYTAANLAELSRAQRVLQDADVMDDAIRADVLAVMLDTPWAGRSVDDIRQQVDRDVSRYRKLLTQVQAMPLADDLRSAILHVEPALDAFVGQAVEISHLISWDRNAATKETGPFEEAFDRLSKANKKLTDLFADRVSEADVAASSAARSAEISIVIASFGAVLVVGIAGQLVGRSVSQALDGVRGAAQAISDGDLSVRSKVLVKDGIGTVAEAVNRMADTLQTMIARLQSEQEQDAFSRQLSEVLEMADTEADTFSVVARGTAIVTDAMPMELLVADSSRAHLERATEHPTQGAPGCTVESPYGCMAVRRGNPVVFESSEALNACSRLRNRPCGPVSAVCVPLSFMGRSLGVLHATGHAGEAPSPRVVSRLTTLGILAGARIGTVRAFQRAQEQASSDVLTGLPNRRSLESTVRGLPPGTPFTLILADLDHFKRLNDKHGHEAGDRALRVFSDVLRRSLREDDHAARWGGEEFAVVLENRNAMAGAEVMERIRANMATAALQGAPSVTASFGIADSTMASTFDQLLRIADDALYRSKEGGRDRGTIGDPRRLNGTVPRRSAEHLAAITVGELFEASGSADSASVNPVTETRPVVPRSNVA